MKSASDEILSFVRVMVQKPEAVTVTEIDGNPTVFEIKSCKGDLSYLMSSVVAIRAIGVMFAGLEDKKFVLKFIEQ
jgi:hypothetical protein